MQKSDEPISQDIMKTLPEYVMAIIEAEDAAFERYRYAMTFKSIEDRMRTVIRNSSESHENLKCSNCWGVEDSNFGSFTKNKDDLQTPLGNIRPRCLGGPQLTDQSKINATYTRSFSPITVNGRMSETESALTKYLYEKVREPLNQFSQLIFYNSVNHNTESQEKLHEKPPVHNCRSCNLNCLQWLRNVSPDAPEVLTPNKLDISRNISNKQEKRSALPPSPTRNFTSLEQRIMIEYLIHTRSISMAKGRKVWKKMLRDGYLRNRTFHSLYDHFRRTLLPQIHCFQMEKKHMLEFQKLQGGCWKINNE